MKNPLTQAAAYIEARRLIGKTDAPSHAELALARICWGVSHVDAQAFYSAVTAAH